MKLIWIILCCWVGAVVFAEELRDPTLPDDYRGGGVSMAQDEMKVGMIVTGNEGRYAYINHHFVAEGDTMDGYTVVSISDHSVTLHKMQQNITLTVSDDFKK